MTDLWLVRVQREHNWATFQESFASESFSSDRDFANFLRNVNPAEVLWEGYGTATHLQWLLWQIKTVGSSQRVERGEVA